MTLKIPPSGCLTFNSKAGETAVVLREWAGYAGNTDSTFVVPILSDGDFTYSATYKAGTPNGVDIVLTKYNKDGDGVWQIFWTGSSVSIRPTTYCLSVLHSVKFVAIN